MQAFQHESVKSDMTGGKKGGGRGEGVSRGLGC